MFLFISKFKKMETEKKVLTFAEGCEYLGYKRSYIYKLTSAGILPFSKPNGKRIYFEREKLEEWMLSGARPGKVERNVEAATYVTTAPGGRKKKEGRV